MKCFYHSADLDGHCSGAIVKARYPECEMIGINYGDPFPWSKIQQGESIWMVDFCLQPFSDMQILNKSCGALTWIDHHKTAIEQAEANGFEVSGCAVLNTEKAACELVWEACFPDASVEMPRGIFYLGRYDIWEHQEHPGSLAFQYGMRIESDTRPEHTQLWEWIFNDDSEFLEEKIEQGSLVMVYEDAQNAKYCRTCAFDLLFDGLRCIVINKAMTGSLAFKSVWDPTRYDAMMSFYYMGGQWHFSLYSDKPTVDVSVICKARGGGGHKGAAGFQCSLLPWYPTKSC